MSEPGIFRPAILPDVPLTIRTAPEEEGRVRRYAGVVHDVVERVAGSGPVEATGASIAALRL